MKSKVKAILITIFIGAGMTTVMIVLILLLSLFGTDREVICHEYTEYEQGFVYCENYSTATPIPHNGSGINW